MFKNKFPSKYISKVQHGQARGQTSLMQTCVQKMRPATHKYWSVLSASLELIQIFQQQIEELLHSQESLEAHGVNELLSALQLLQRHRHRHRLRPRLAAVILPPLIDVTCQRRDVKLDLGDPVEGVRDQVVVTLQDRHYGGGSIQTVSRWTECQISRDLQREHQSVKNNKKNNNFRFSVTTNRTINITWKSC